MGEEKFTEFCVDVLKEEGYSPKIDEDGDVTFKCEGSTLLLDIHEDDPDYMCLVHLCECKCENETERQKLFNTTAEINEEFKIIKISVEGELGSELVVFKVEALVDSREQFKLHLERWIELLMSVPREFYEKLEAASQE